MQKRILIVPEQVAHHIETQMIRSNYLGKQAAAPMITKKESI